MDKELFADLLNSVHEMVDIENGEIQPKPEHIHRHAIPDVKSIRESVGMGRQEFVEMIGASFWSLKSWEQKRRIPSGTALKMLCLIEKNPNIIETLKSI
ncbi:MULTISPECIES: NadS family protein [Xenorhabdus]|uniref:NadS family protein n=1 Tax=Xenorhabdus TaxID=626 RepID=UPI00064A5978|nr:MULTISPECIES: transcriptional regulator [Xenorhabdus]KLU16913.1 XRE family transcriptional regulator [Xenorhabdus griffiniae]KOP33728.1 XRE family transcriptional regulator [Xenorhabdus sp. GDc328]